MGKRILFLDLHRPQAAEGQTAQARAAELHKHLKITGGDYLLCDTYVQRCEIERDDDHCSIFAVTTAPDIDDALLVELFSMLVSESAYSDNPAHVVSPALYQAAFKRLGRAVPDLRTCHARVEQLRALWWGFQEFKQLYRFNPNVQPARMRFYNGIWHLLYEMDATPGVVRLELEDLRKITSLKKVYPVQQYYKQLEVTA
jgi:hypothetical protein